MLRLSSASLATPTDRAEADALDAMADELDRLALAVVALAQTGRGLAAALRARGCGQCDGPRMAFVIATSCFIVAWHAAQGAIAEARDTTKAGLYDD